MSTGTVPPFQPKTTEGKVFKYLLDEIDRVRKELKAIKQELTELKDQLYTSSGETGPR